MEKILLIISNFGHFKPLLSDKIKSSEKIILVEQRETLDTDGNIDDKIVEIL